MAFFNSVTSFLVLAALIINSSQPASNLFVVNLIFYAVFTPILATIISRIMFAGENSLIVEDALKRVDDILNIRPFEQLENPKRFFRHDIRIENLSFGYDGSNRSAINNINILIKEKSMVAFVGFSGSGKTTLANLITRFYEPKEGKIFIGDIDIKDVSMDELNRNIAYVFQDSRLFRGSILENVRLGKADASIDEVQKALEDAQCKDIISKLPNGVNTVLGTKGMYLSGGEKQRIAIARCFLKDAPIVVFDEATAFADPENERLVSKAFKNLSKNKTVIMIAHRLTSITDADEIFVFDDGRIIANGKHNDLVDNCSQYQKLWSNYQKSINWKVRR